MTNTYRTQVPPPPPVDQRLVRRKDEQRSLRRAEAANRVAVTLFLTLGMIIWGIGIVMWATGDDEANDAMRNYAAAIALAVVGGTLFIVAAIFDNRS
jgi:hypothetical protein